MHDNFTGNQLLAAATSLRAVNDGYRGARSKGTHAARSAAGARRRVPPRPAPALDDDLLTGLSGGLGAPDRQALVVVAPHDLLRRRILSVLREDSSLDELTVAPGVEDLGGAAPNILLLASGHGLKVCGDLLRRLRRRLPKTRLVVIADRDSRMSVRAAVEAGVDGLVFQEELESALAPTVRAVAAGQTAVPRDRRLEIDRPNLSARERQVLELVVDGLSNQAVGRRLFLSEATVKTHLSVIFRKLGVRSRSEAAALVLARRDELGLGFGAPSRWTESGR